MMLLFGAPPDPPALCERDIALRPELTDWLLHRKNPAMVLICLLLRYGLTRCLNGSAALRPYNGASAAV